MSIHLSECNTSSPTWKIFMKFNIWVLFENLSLNSKFELNLTRKRVLYMKTDIHFWSNLSQLFLEWET
jgi:hypothetical protein